MGTEWTSEELTVNVHYNPDKEKEYGYIKVPKGARVVVSRNSRHRPTVTNWYQCDYVYARLAEEASHHGEQPSRGWLPLKILDYKGTGDTVEKWIDGVTAWTIAPLVVQQNYSPPYEKEGGYLDVAAGESVSVLRSSRSPPHMRNRYHCDYVYARIVSSVRICGWLPIEILR